MKKYFSLYMIVFVVAAAFLLAINIIFPDKAKSENGRMYNTVPIVGSLAAGTTITTDAVNLETFQPGGAFSMMVDVTGDGTLKIQYEVSNVKNATGAPPTDGQFVKPSGASDIVTAHIDTSGTAGLDFYQFPGEGEPIFAKWIRFKLTETTTTDGVTYLIYTNFQ